MDHTCSALVLTCMDYRFWKKLVDFIITKEELFDVLSLAGGAKNCLDESIQKIIFNSIQTSINLHGIKKIYIVNHTDCGAYGGSKNFLTKEDEKNKLLEDLQNAEIIIKKEFPKTKVIKIFLNWDEISIV